MATIANLNVLLGLEAQSFVKALNNAQRNLQRFGRDAERAGRQMTTALTLPILGVGTAAAKMAVDFDTALRQVVGLVGVAQDQVDEWRGQLLAMAPEVGKAPTELANALFFVTSAGLRGAAAIDTVRASAQAAAAGLGDAQIVADAVTSAINAYGDANLSAAKATGVLVATVREGKASAESLAPVFGTLLPFATELGVSFDQLGAALAHITRTGKNAAEASTQVANILLGLAKPTEKANKMFAQFGTSAAELRQEVREKGLLAGLIKLRDIFGEDTEALGKAFKSAEAFGGILTLTRNHGADAQAIFDSLAKTTGKDLADAFKVAAAGPGFKLAQLLAELKAAAIVLGDAILPVLIPMARQFKDVLSKAAEAFASWSPAVKQVVIVMAALVAAAGPVLLVVGAIATGMALVGSSTALVAGGLAAAAALIVANWDKVSAALSAVFAFLAPAAKAMADFVVGQWEKVKAAAERIWPKLQEVVGKVVAAITKFWAAHGEKILGFVKAAWEGIKLAIDAASTLILGVVEGFVDLLNGDWKGLKETAVRTFQEMMAGAGKYVAAGVAGMAALWNDLEVAILLSIGNLLGKVQTFAAAVATIAFFDPAVRNAAKGALGVLQKAYEGLGEEISKNASEAEAWRATAAAILAPVADAKENLVQYRSEWVTVGGQVEQTATDATRIFGEATERMTGTLTGGFGKAADQMKAKFMETAVAIEGRKITADLRLRVDWEAFDREMKQRGLTPDTSGAVP